MNTSKRHGKKWTHNEVLALQREYELLELDLQTIATKHCRSVNSIIYKLYAEGFTDTLLTDMQSKKKVKIAKNEVHFEDSNCDEDEDEDVNKNINTLTDRVWSLETSVSNITSMVKQMFNQITTKKVKSSVKI
jgi:hypothetical protein